LLILDEQLSFSLVEMVLGGSPGNNMVIPNRGMSAIELNVMRDVINSACPELVKGFSQLEEIQASLVEVVSNLRLLNFVAAEVGVVSSRFKVTIDNVEGSITLVIPHTTLEPLQKKQQSKAVPDSLLKGSKWQKLVCDELEQMKVGVEAQLGTVSLRVRDILNFQVGDVVELDFKPEAPLTVMVEQRPKFKAVAGVQNGKKAIRILGRIPQGG
jgi:flagellar motor switch protein FliM